MTEHTSPAPILVPIDFSAYSEKTLLKAIEIADCQQAPILVLHVIHDPAQMPGYYSRYTKKKHLLRIEDMAKEMLDEFLGRMIDEHPDIDFDDKVESMLVTGLPVTRILQVIDQVKPSMLVMGSKGITGLKHLMIGSVAEQVVRLSPVSITIVK